VERTSSATVSVFRGRKREGDERKEGILATEAGTAALDSRMCRG